MANLFLVAVFSYLPGVRVILVFVSVLLLVKTILEQRAYENLPPGPWGLPLFGATFRLGVNPGRSLYELSKKYGKIFSIKLGPRLTVVINDADLVREAYGKKAEATSARENYPLDWMDTSGALISCSGSDVKPLRRFLLRSLRDFGLGKKSSELLIMEEAQHLCRGLDQMVGKSFDPRDMIQMATANIICTLCFGQRFDYASPEFNQLIASLQAVSHVSGFTLARDFPFLFLAPRYKVFRDGGTLLRKMMDNIMDQHKLTFDPQSPRDVTDKLYQETSADKCQFSFGDDRVFRTMIDLFGAGADTTSTVLQFAVWQMALNPNVQTKVLIEILTKVGTKTPPEMADRARLPYTYATINEVLRMNHPVPVNLLHRATKAFDLAGYTIPKDADMITPMWSMNMDPTVWKDPEKFDPERFLTADGTTVTSPEGFIPFSSGSRMCLGEGLARSELFLFFATIMQRFTFHLPPDSLRSHSGHFGFYLWFPNHFKIQASQNFD